MAAEPKRARGLDTGGNVHGRLGKAAWGTATHHLITSPVCAVRALSCLGRGLLGLGWPPEGAVSPTCHQPPTGEKQPTYSPGSSLGGAGGPHAWSLHGGSVLNPRGLSTAPHTARAPTLSSPPPAPKLESCVQEVARGGEVRPEGSKGRWPWTEPPRSPGLSLWARGPKTTQDGEGQACSVGKIRGAWRTGWDERGSCHATPGPSARGGAG